MTSLEARSEHVSSLRGSLNVTPQCPRVRVVRRVSSCSAQVRKTTSSESGKRRVTFASEIREHATICRSDMNEGDFHDIWYCKEDFKNMKKEYIPIIKKMAKGLPLDENEEDRGLEHKTPLGNKKKHKNRLVSIDSVLREQDRQWERNRLDPAFIAELYVQASAHCQLQASLVAKSDEEYVNKVVRQLSTISESEDDNGDTPSEEKGELFQRNVVAPTPYELVADNGTQKLTDKLEIRALLCMELGRNLSLRRGKDLSLEDALNASSILALMRNPADDHIRHDDLSIGVA